MSSFLSAFSFKANLMPYKTLFALTMLSCATASVTAQEIAVNPANTATTTTNPEAKPALWSVYGFVGHFSQSAYPGSSVTTQKTLAIPYFVYRGEKFQIDRRGAKVSTIKQENFKLDLDLGLNFGSDANDVPERAGMKDLGTVIEAGPSAKITLHRLKDANIHLGIPVRAAFNLSDGFKYEGLTLNPQLSYERSSTDGWSYEARVGPVLADQQYQANYYQVDPEFVTANRAAYKAKAGLLSWRASLGVAKVVTPQLRLLGTVRYETVNGAANQDSPLVKEKNGFSFFLGLNYLFWESETRGK